jgi:hypothetical protein
MKGIVEDKKLDIMQTDFRWPVWTNGYRWNHEIKTYWKEPPYLVETKGSGGYKYENLLETKPSLFLEFAELQPTMKCILEFANRYGKLSGEEMDVTVPKDSGVNFNASKIVQREKQIVCLAKVEPLSFWQEEIQKMKWITQVWRWTQNRQMDFLRRIINISDTEVSFIIADQEVLEQYSTSEEVIRASQRNVFDFYAKTILPEDEPVLFQRIGKDDFVLCGKIVLVQEINDRLSHEDIAFVHPILLLDKENQIGPYLIPNNLLVAMWLQFYLTASGERRFVRCRVCGKWEDATDRSKNWSVHQECATRERMKRYRQRLKEQSEVEMTISHKKPSAKKPSAKKPAKKASAKKPAGKKAAKGGAK